MRTLILIVLIALTTSEAALAASDPEYARASVQQLVDALVNVDAQTVALHSTLFVSAFIAEDSPDEVEGGVFGSAAPKRFPQMVELVRRGVDSLPLLIDHLDDKRATKLTVGSTHFFSWEYFSDEYDPRIRSVGQLGASASLSHHGNAQEALKALDERRFEGEYTVRVGDLCYVLIGQIVNRQFLAVRYQPSAILVVNSPIEAPALMAAVKRDWGGIDSNGLMASLLADARASDDPRFFGPALQRLRFYYPNQYQRQAAGELWLKIREFEANERK